MTQVGGTEISLLIAALVSLSVCAGLHLHHRSTLRRAAKRLTVALSGNEAATRARAETADFTTCLGQVCDRLGMLEHRLVQRHPITGLETRELLLDALEAAPTLPRTLGIVELADFDALAVFDVEAADKVLDTIAQRLIRMMPAGRMLAQIDRATFAILFEADAADHAPRELHALNYALRGRVSVPTVEYLPQIRHGHVRIDVRVTKAAVALARAMAAVRAHTSERQSTPFAARPDVFALEQDLRQAVEKHQFELWYQPVVDAAAGALCSVEALIRWRHPVRGLVPPGQFIPAMENMGLSEEIGHWVLDRAVRDAAAWTRAGLDHVKVAVNLSAHQLVRTDLDVIVERVLARHGLRADMLELELTETAAAVDPAAVRVLFGKLRASGVTMAIDDFGAGYASLSYLKQLDFDKLKIDREFVTDVDSDKQSQAICQSIIALARGLDLTVLGEGVERREEFEWLHAQGCTLFQGYYFSKPLTYDELLAFATVPGAILDKCAPRAASRRPHFGALAA